MSPKYRFLYRAGDEQLLNQGPGASLRYVGSCSKPEGIPRLMPIPTWPGGSGANHEDVFTRKRVTDADRGAMAKAHAVEDGKCFSIKFFAHLIPLAKTRQSSTLMIGFRESNIQACCF